MNQMLQRILNQMSSHRLACVIGLLVIFAVCLKWLPLWFIGFTILATLIVMVRCEEEIAAHQRKLYTDAAPTKNTKRRILGTAILKGVWIGVLAGTLPAISVAGATSGADVIAAVLFMVCVVAATLVLFYLREKRGIRPLQFGLVKMAFPTGFAYALVQMARPSMRGREIAGKTWDTVKAAAKSNFEVEEIFKTLNSFLVLVDGVLHSLCVGIFGEIGGRVAHLFLTVDLAYGISITALALSLLVVWDWLEPQGAALTVKQGSSS